MSALPPASIAGSANAYAPKHFVPASGLAAFSAPDGRQAAAAQLDPGLDVQVIEWDGAWAHVLCSNGWLAWVDGRLLLPHAEESALPPSTGDTGATAPAVVRGGPPAALRLLLRPRGLRAGASTLSAVGPFAAVGAVLALVGGFLPLISVLGFSISPWQVPAQFLLTDSPAPSGFSLGILLLLVALVALPLLIRHPLPPLALLAIAGPATNTGVHVVLRKLESSDYPDVGIGAVMLLVGGFLIAGEALRSAWLGRREAFA